MSLDVLEDESRFTVDARRVGRRGRAGTAWWVPPVFRRLADNLLVREGDEHRRLRRRVDRAFRRGALDRLQPIIEHRVAVALDTLASRPDPCLVRDVARPVPLGVICDLLGLAPADSEPDRPLGRALHRLSSVSGAAGIVKLVPAMRTIEAALLHELRDRERQPRDDLLSELVAPDDEDARPLTDAERVAMVFLLFVAGHETTTHLISLGAWRLLDADGDRSTDASPLSAIDVAGASELLRATSPVELSKPRFLITDTELGGVRLKRGSTVAALIGAANLDDRVWDRPEAIDLSRPPARHLGFGSGRHACLGLQLALRETAAVMRSLGERHPALRLSPGASETWHHRIGLRAMRALPIDPASLAQG